MRVVAIASILAVGAFFSGCAGLPSADAPKTRLSPDYVAAGDTAGVRAFVYGARTVLVFDQQPASLSVYDENGVPVAYEKEGRYYRLARKLGNFSIWANLRRLRVVADKQVTSVAAQASQAAALPVAVSQAVSAPSPAAPVLLQASAPAPADADALLKVSALQLDDIRKAIAAGPATAAESKALNARLDRVEAQLIHAATAIVRVQFDTAKTDFVPDRKLADALIPAAKAAARINVRGRTDSRMPGPDDQRIALGRALAARAYLVDHGVDAGKIKVFSLPAGDFVAPNSPEGRAFNRRVEIELINTRYAALQRQVADLKESH